MRASTLIALAALVALAALAAPPALAQQAGQPAAQAAAQVGPATPPELRTVVGDKPIEIAADKVPPALEQFLRTGQNPYAGDEAAIAEGKKLYAKLCQACHMPDGSGRIGPSLRDEQWRHPRLDSEAGRFEIIHSGGAGAMQAFSRRMSNDEILQVMAYIDTLRSAGG
jgi:cytochrome c-L